MSNKRSIPSDDASPLRLDGSRLVKQSQSDVAVRRGRIRSLNVSKNPINSVREIWYFKRNMGILLFKSIALIRLNTLMFRACKTVTVKRSADGW